jgi:KpsF/GutQ family protein|tara:strand:+ start:327 stop:1019 length:693 start_codon:yes stop_codon:yes gene_type:complete
MIGTTDVALLLSNRGASGEVILIAEYCREQKIPIIAVTQSDSTPLAKIADISLAYGEFEEACPLRLAPSTSTTLMLALGDALALAVQNEKGFTESDFSKFHPAGSLGRRMKKVETIMRKGDQIARVKSSAPVFEAMTALSKARCGLCLITDESEHLVGVYSDGDFRRDGMEQIDLQEPVGNRCARPGKRIQSGRIVGEALNLMREARINALPVVDEDGIALGLLDIQDLA